LPFERAQGKVLSASTMPFYLVDALRVFVKNEADTCILGYFAAIRCLRLMCFIVGL